MRYVPALLILALSILWAGAAHANADPATNQRTLSFRVVESCDYDVTAGEVVLNWADGGGDYALYTVEYEDYPHPVSVLVYTGCPDFSTLDDHAAMMLCMKPTCKRPDVYCAPRDICNWYLYCTTVEWCCDEVTVLAYLPCNMALDVTDLW